MKLAGLKPGTKLMWDAQGADHHYLYPAIVSSSNGAPNKYIRDNCVRITTGYNTSWMGPEEENLRLPTELELEELIWPELKVYQ